MNKLFLAAGVAALAITAPAVAGQGQSGGGKDRGAKVEKADRGGKARAAQAGKQNKANRVEHRANRSDRQVKAKGPKVERAERVRVDRDKSSRMAERRSKDVDKALDRRANAVNRLVERREQRLDRVADRRTNLDLLRTRDWSDRVIVGRNVGWNDGCPPGLAKKPVPCVPPGQVNKLVGERIDIVDDVLALSAVPQRLRVIYPDTDDYYHRFGNGYVYRVNRETQLINALLPLFGLGVGIGQPFPASYSNYALPMGLQPFYPATAQSQYRYANGYVYQINPLTGLVEDVDPMLGYGYGYGQMMPLSYSAYNVPYQYRPFYADTPDHYYRYAPGAIYRVDSGSGLIDAVAALLTGGMTVGQPMPMGYDVYNVPLAYRAQYYDTPDSWYRYSNGHIYQVDPTTRLVTALITALT